jgi:hypothetical protein
MRDPRYDEPEPADVEVCPDTERYTQGYADGYAERMPPRGSHLRTDSWYRKGWGTGAKQRKADALRFRRER